MTSHNSTHNRRNSGVQTRLSRRSVMKSAVAGLGLLAGGRIAMPADTAPKKIRMGVVGGGFGAAHLWDEEPDCVVEAVSDLREDRRRGLAQRFKCGKTYNSLEELVLDRNIDAVAIFTEGPNHVKHTVLAMQHGKHVFCAVPACMGYSVQEGLDQAGTLLDCVRTTGLTYMMAETSYYQYFVISMRRAYQAGVVAGIHYCESEYLHPGLEGLWFAGGKPTWRHGAPPMFYPTHCTAHLIGITGERLTEVTCLGWGDGDPQIKGNAYGDNPFWNETAMFRTTRGNPFRVRVWWRGPVRGAERCWWYAEKMPQYEQRHDWYRELLPPAMHHPTGHENSHGFLAHEFIQALVRGRKPAIDVYEALAYTVPGIIAHQSALKGGEVLKIPQFDRPG